MASSWLSAVKRRHSQERPQITETIKPMKSSRHTSLNYQQSNIKQYFSAAMKDLSHEKEECSKSSSSFKRIKMEKQYINDSKQSDSVCEKSRNVLQTSNLKLNNAFIQVETIVLSSSDNDSPCENNSKSFIQTEENKAKTSANVKQDAEVRADEKREGKTRANEKPEAKTRPNEKQDAKTRPNEQPEFKHSLSPRVMVVPLSSYSQNKENLWDSLSFHTGTLLSFKPLSPFGTELVLETPTMLDETNNEKREGKTPKMLQTKTVTDEKLANKSGANEKPETKTGVTVVPLSSNNEKLWTKTRPNEKQEVKHSLSQSQEHLWGSLSLHTGTLIPFKPLSPFGTELVLESPPMVDDTAKPGASKDLDSQFSIHPLPPLTMNTEVTIVQVDEKRDGETKADEKPEIETRVDEKPETKTRVDEEQEAQNILSPKMALAPASSNSQSQEHLWDSLSFHTGTLMSFKPLTPFGTELVLETPPIHDVITKVDLVKENNDDTFHSLTPDSLMSIRPFTRRTDLTLNDLRVDEEQEIQNSSSTISQSQVQ